jgi:hypothetical protein
LKRSTAPDRGVARLRFGGLAGALDVPLAGYQDLLAYAEMMDRLASGDHRQERELGSSSHLARPSFSEVELPSIEELLAQTADLAPARVEAGDDEATAVSTTAGVREPSEILRIHAAKDSRGAVIFLHGFSGDQLSTWHPKSERTASWLHWLGEDIPGIDVLSVGWGARSFGWLGQSSSLAEYASNVFDLLRANGLFDKPAVFVAHSLGGVLVKQMLKLLSERSQSACPVRGIIFLAASPASAQLDSGFRHIWQRLLQLSDRREDENFRELDVWYNNNAIRLGINTLLLYETRGTTAPARGLEVPGIVPIFVDADHISIAKVKDRTEVVYREILGFSKRCLAEPASDSSLGSLNIFLSSTVRDLAEERRRVSDALHKAGHRVSSLENFVARDELPLQTSTSILHKCDMFIGIVAWEYGWIPETDNPNQLSITELEYNFAVESNIPCLIFLLDDSAPVSAGHRDRDTRRIAKFRARLQRHLVTYFLTTDELIGQVVAAVAHYEGSRGQIPARPFNLPGRPPADARLEVGSRRSLTCRQRRSMCRCHRRDS